MIKDLTFITGSQDKVEQLSKYLGVKINLHKLDLDEIQSLSPKEVIEHKANQAYEILKVPVIVDDVSLSFTSLNGLPGPFIKYFMKALSHQQICDLAHKLETQGALAEVCIGYYDNNGFKLFTGDITGTISTGPRGENGFGWDKFFIPEGYTKTRAELNDDEYDQTSPRRLALEKFEKFFHDQSIN